MRPYRQRVPVRRLTPTIRHPSELLTPLAINLVNSWRCPLSGTGPGLPTSPDFDPITTSKTSRCCDVRWNPPLSYPPGRALTGEQVTDRPDLATARLTGHLAPAADETRRAVTATYQALRNHPFQPSPPAAEPDAGVERATDVNVIARAGPYQ